MMVRPQQRLVINGLVVSDGAGEVTHPGGFSFETLASDASFGHAEPLRISLATGLLDGEQVEITGYGNREDMYYLVRVRASDAEGLAQGGRLLEEATGRPGELQWTPPALFGETTVFDVATSDLVWLFDDMDETRAMRVYGLRIEAYPFGRPVEPVVVPATGSGDPTPPPTPVETMVYDGSTSSGWSPQATVGATLQGPPTVPTGVRLQVDALTTASVTLGLAYEPDFVTGADGLLVIKHATGGGQSQGISVQAHYAIAPGVTTPETLPRIATADGWAYYQVPAGRTVLRLVITSSFSTPASVHAPWLSVEQIKRTSGMPYTGTARQLFRSFPVHGTRRTTGSLHISHTDPLGAVTAYCGSDDGSGYQPASRSHKTAGGSDIADATTMSGARTSLASPFEVQIPRSLLPAGTYSIWGRLRSSGTTTLGFTVETQPVGGAIPLPTITLPSEVAVPLTSSWGMRYLARMTLGRTPDSSGGTWEQRVRVTKVGASSAEIDDLYLFNHTTGSLVILDDVQARHLWIDAPTVERPFPKMYAGNNADRSDATNIGHTARKWEELPMPPGTMNVFTAISQPNAAVAAEYYPRVAHNVYKIASA